MHEMLTIAPNVPVAWCVNSLLVCLLVYQSVTRLRLAKPAEQIEILFGVETLGDPRLQMRVPISAARRDGVGESFSMVKRIQIVFRLIRQTAPNSMRPPPTYFGHLSKIITSDGYLPQWSDAII